jgi:DNA-binding NtrC family response regulator/pSer/pThr/pTyr-binding forkhead associated (FHA) protein
LGILDVQRARSLFEGTASDAANTAETVEGTFRALYVTTPKGGTRHVLLDGKYTIGRGKEADVVLDDAHVSRSHAELSVASDMSLSDLGSANGTFLGDERLVPGEATVLGTGQAFLVGDSALVVRRCSLRRPSSAKLSRVDQVRERFSALPVKDGDSTMIVLRVRAPRRIPAPALEAILAEFLGSPRDWMLWLGSDDLLLGCEPRGGMDAHFLERRALDQLVSWGIAAEVKGKVVSGRQVERAGDDFRTLLAADASSTLVRGRMILGDPVMKELEQVVLRVAPAAVNVLILGETGAGKDVFAALVHELSARAEEPFLGLNCASLPEQLLESELFGYERGAFTGAVSAKPGLFESANGGTVFLDEIGDLPLPLQAKLLRVIESREVTRLGALKAREIDVRFVAATNHDVARAVAEGRFRQDLYYRLNSVTLKIPPLRERPSDIEPLAQCFLERARGKFETGRRFLSPASLLALSTHTWPGNVRELRSVIERAVLLTPGPVIEPEHLAIDPDADIDREPSRVRKIAESERHLRSPEVERARIVRALDACGGNQSQAARFLRMPRRTLVRRIAQFGLPRPKDKP